MTVRSILNSKGTDVVTATLDNTVLSIIDLLAKKRIGAVVIINDNRGIEGIVSERDIVREINSSGPDILSKPIGDIMTRNVVTCQVDTTIADVMQLMTGGKFRHVPVVEAGRLHAIISIGDVVKARIAQAEQEAAAMRDYIATG